MKGKKSAGTPLYMPPESEEGASNQAGDIWALGVTLLVLLSGRHPDFSQQKIDPLAEVGKLKDVS
jgi:serine/threonine protein kinase